METLQKIQWWTVEHKFNKKKCFFLPMGLLCMANPPVLSVFHPAPASLSHKTILTGNWWDNIVRGVDGGGGGDWRRGD